MEQTTKSTGSSSANLRSKKFIALFAGGAILLILIVWIISTRQSLINKEEEVNKQWGEVQSTYQRRLSLIPNLVSVIKGTTQFEGGTLVDVINARMNEARRGIGQAPTSDNYQQQTALQDSVAHSVNRVIAVVENYPDLKATQQFRGLQAQLEGTERRIKFARSDFNKAVREYNTKVRSFPSNIIAGMFGFKRKEGFIAEAGADKAVEIKF